MRRIAQREASPLMPHWDLHDVFFLSLLLSVHDL
jgi:hypothetical protein